MANAACPSCATLRAENGRLERELSNWRTLVQEQSKDGARLSVELEAARILAGKLLRYAEHRAYCDTSQGPGRACTCHLEALAEAADLGLIALAARVSAEGTGAANPEGEWRMQRGME